MWNSSKALLAVLALSASTAVWATTPLIIAHRGGTGDGPENTTWVIDKSIQNNADAIWITLQLTKDNVIVLYRPSDLSALTNLSGTVSSYTANRLAQADAAFKYSPPAFPLRGKGIGIPTLQEVLKKWPNTFFFLDIKSPDASPAQFARVLADTLQQQHALERVRVYSTDQKYLDALPQNIPRFESRDLTRSVLANITMNHTCSLNPQETQDKWYGFEFKREVQVIEKFTLGEGVTKSFLQWDKEAIDCFKKHAGNNIVLFGINTPEDYQQAKALGAAGVLVDSPAQFKQPAQR